MKAISIPDVVAGGIDDSYYPQQNKAALVHNYRYDPQGGWRNDRGWEPLIPYASPLILTTTQLTDAQAPCRFLAVWTRHAGSEEYVVQERNGNLFYDFGNIGSAASRTVTLATNRHLPRSDEPGTQFVPYGRFALLLNGHDEMLKWWGRAKVETFGFSQVHPTPVALPVQVDYNRSIGITPGTPNEINNPAINNNLVGISLQFAADEYLGLGDPAQGSVNSYSWRYSYVTDTGSEGPLSEAVTTSWTLYTTANEPDPDIAAANARKYGVVITGLEPGPNGTVARNAYRTKNKRDGVEGAGDIYYFVGRIDDNTTSTYTDVVPDNQLVNEAPSIADSVPYTTSHKYGATWNGSMWLGGGDILPTQLRYSKPGLPEQFGAFDTFDVGVREGGAITALVPYYNALLVFREHAIDAVFRENGEYVCSTVNSSIGTIATESIKLIPGVGVMFLNKNGFYLLTGGFQGGASFEVKSVSKPINKELGRVSVNALARSSATYSDKEKEYWCHFPVDGATENTHGASFNTLTNEWSLRGNTTSESNYDWTFTKLATDASGWILLGTLPTNSSSNLFPGFGIQVWSARRSLGDSLVPVLIGQSYTVTVTDHGLDPCIWQSTWNDYGDDSVKKRVVSVELETITEGNGTVELQWASDYNLDWVSAGLVQRQIGEYVNSPSTDPTFDSGANIATWNTSKWQDHKPTRLRWDVNTGLISQFAFRVITTSVTQIVKYQTNVIIGNVKTPNTNMPGSF